MATLENLQQTLYQHQHSGSDFTQPLRNLDFQQIGRTVLSSAATSISVTIPPKRFLRILITWGAKSGASDDYLRFNSDSGTNYTTTTGTSQGQIDIRNGANSALGGFSIIEVGNNLPSLVKPAFIHSVNRITSAGTAISSNALFAVWVNTLNQITTVTLTSSNAETYPANTELIVYGSKE